MLHLEMASLLDRIGLFELRRMPELGRRTIRVDILRGRRDLEIQHT